jgi:hypothetical protein
MYYILFTVAVIGLCVLPFSVLTRYLIKKLALS